MSFAEGIATTGQPYKFGGKQKENWQDITRYDFGARYYNPVLAQFGTGDPMMEKYYGWSIRNYCGDNPMKFIDPTGTDWYQNNENKYYTWFEGKGDIKGYTHIGDMGSVLGEYEKAIDNMLTKTFQMESLYSQGFTFDIAPLDKGAMVGSKERGWDFFDEFVNGTGPEFTVLTADHPYTKAMEDDDKVKEGQQAIFDGDTTVPGQVTSVRKDWGLWDVITTSSKVKQFIGSYSYSAFTSKDGKHLINVIGDSKSRSSLLYHLYPNGWNKRRSQQKIMSNTYQFYIWQSPKKQN
jgi:RHS repeat-associated protein